MYNTELLKANSESIQHGGELLRLGKLVVFPTETVYGIGANALDANAVEKIFIAKGRPQDNPLIVHVNSVEEVMPLVRMFPPVAKKLAEAFWPGPLTMILPRSGLVPASVSAGLDTVAIRVPSHPVARQLIAAAGVPVAAPSANRSGRPSPTSAQHCITDLNGHVDLILDGGECEVGVESTVITLAGEKPRILRPGGITPEQLEEIIGSVEIDHGVINPVEGQVSSPGMKYRHYAPKAHVTLLNGSLEQFENFCKQHKQPGMWAVLFDEDMAKAKNWDIPVIAYGSFTNANTQANRLFAMLRELDEKNAQVVYIRAPKPQGMGLAVYNRLLRAASFKQYDLEENMPFMIGLTGQTGAGKSYVAEHLRELGYDVIDADAISREVVQQGKPCLSDIAQVFGTAVLTNTGELDRKAVAEIVFSNLARKKQFEDIIFPYIMEEIQIIADSLKAKSRVVFLDGPTLFESGANKGCAKIVSVLAPDNLRLERILKRDAISVELAQKRIASQHSSEFFSTHSNYVINNNSTPEALRDNVEKMLSELDLLPELNIARECEYEEILAMYRDAGDDMRQRGIIQWDEIYPSCEMLKNDIKQRHMYIIRAEGEIVVAFVLNTVPNDEYGEVTWRYTNGKHGVLHRLCVSHKAQGCGWGVIAMLHVHRLARECDMESMRLDAFMENPAALRLYEKLGYEKAGVVYFREGPFAAYEKKLI